MSNNILTTSFLKAMKEGKDNKEIKNFKIDKSNIHGKGVIATKKIKPGEYINTALYKAGDDYFDTTTFGGFLNHSYKPNARTRFEEDFYRTYSETGIEPGDEITVDYKKNKELEQPGDDWK